MARREQARPATVTALPPPPAHPPGGYDEQTVAEAAEILRHQTRVLSVRTRIAAAAGAAPVLALPLPAERAEQADAEQVQPLIESLRAATDELRGDAQAVLTRVLEAGKADLDARTDELRTLSALEQQLQARLGELRALLRVDELAQLSGAAAAIAKLEEHVAPLERNLRSQVDALAQLGELATVEQSLRAHVDQLAPVVEAGGRLDDRVDELAAAAATLRELLARETALVEREESTRTRAEELAIAERAVAELQEVLAVQAASLETIESVVSKKERTLEHRERELVEHERAAAEESAALVARAKQVDAAEQSSGRAADELAARAAELDALEEKLRRAADALDERALDLDSRSTALERDIVTSRRERARIERERVELDERARALSAAEQAFEAARSRLQEAKPDPAPARDPEPAPPAQLAAFNVETLSSLVERHAADFPAEVEEWRWYLISLRNVADSGGALPASVDGLVRDVFAPLLERTAA